MRDEIFARADVDESGELRVTMVHPHGVSPATLARNAAGHRRRREAAWRENPQCVECETTLPVPDDAAVVMLGDGDRVACRIGCFGKAVRALASAEQIRPEVAD